MKTKATGNVFYVYEHWRTDTGECFYVGKGHGRRAHDLTRRKNFHAHTIQKVIASGHSVEVKLFATDLPEQEALALEVVRIAHWRALGVTLANITNGGEGASGHRHSDETRARIKANRALQVRKPCSEEAKEKIRAAQLGVKKGPNPAHSARMRGRKSSLETREKIAAAHTGSKRSEQARANMSRAQRGHGTSDEARKNMSLAHLGNAPSDETRRKMSESQVAGWITRVNRYPSEEARAKMSASAKARCARGQMCSRKVTE